MLRRQLSHSQRALDIDLARLLGSQPPGELRAQVKHHSSLTHLLTGSGIQPQPRQAQITANRREQIAPPAQLLNLLAQSWQAVRPTHQHADRVTLVGE